MDHPMPFDQSPPPPPRGIRDIETPEGPGVAIYHVVFAGDGFEETANILLTLVREAAVRSPGAPRYLFLDIDGHRNSEGGFDRDMFELQVYFIPAALGRFLTEYALPLGTVRPVGVQSDDVPGELRIEPPGDSGGGSATFVRRSS